jgi:hypothetical protein
MAGEKVTEHQLAKKEKQAKPGVILKERFVRREKQHSPDGDILLPEPDEIIAHLAAHFTLNNLNSCVLPAGADDAESDDMPRFQQSLRDGLQVPKEG